MTRRAAIIPMIHANGETKLACPRCGSDTVHPIAIVCQPPGRNGGILRVDASGVHWDGTSAPPGRGVLIELDFGCEQGHAFRYCLQFHKGTTFLTGNCDDAARPESVVWRD